ncbi:MAG: hypothetical protein HQM12_17895 [SAR324 cluster bacterium]|nr:hypothetical protein [SAR324 cluster bacterium]
MFEASPKRTRFQKIILILIADCLIVLLVIWLLKQLPETGPMPPQIPSGVENDRKPLQNVRTEVQSRMEWAEGSEQWKTCYQAKAKIKCSSLTAAAITDDCRCEPFSGKIVCWVRYTCDTSTRCCVNPLLSCKGDAAPLGSFCQCRSRFRSIISLYDGMVCP